ncbi:MAG: D-beta-D-heptose 7-phosphate kinase/D-beta-D-heptose 1-phosphate adenosyltransferase, partial [Pirellulaceae bacterium]
EQAKLAGRRLCEQFGVDAVVVTLDRDGMVLVAGDQEQVFPTRPRRVYDITGAGDIVLATLGLGQAAGLSLPNCIELANVAAGLEVEQVGVVPIPRTEIEKELSGESGLTQSKLISASEAAEVADNARRRGQSVVFTNGCFDLLHVGHVTYLQEAAALGDLLIIGMNSDNSIRRLKGESRPVIHQQNRAALLAALQCVDYVVVFDVDTPCDLLAKIRPDILVKGGTYSPDEVVGKEIVESYGGTVCVTTVSVNVSTTKIVEQIRQQDAAD